MKFEIKTEYERRASPLKVDVSVRESSDEPMRAIGDELFQTKRILMARIFVEFWANDAQLEHKTRQAEATARAYLFKDLLPMVERIMMESDSQEVLSLAIDLKKAMLGQS